jgi:hypothetical protein
MDSCYISYIFSQITGNRLPFSKEMSIQKIGSKLAKYGGKKYLILFRFDDKINFPIIITLWIPNYNKIGDLIYPNWSEFLKTCPKDSILITPRGDFKISNINIKFIDYCKSNYIKK